MQYGDHARRFSAWTRWLDAHETDQDAFDYWTDVWFGLLWMYDVTMLADIYRRA